MSEKIQAIDFMYYVATREFMEQWDRAKEGELICRMEKAIGGLPRFASIAEMLRQMDDAGVEKVFITQFASHRCFQNPSAKVATEIID